MPHKILVISSSFPVSDTDPVIAFVREQIVAIKKQHSDLEFTVLAPHNSYNLTPPPREAVVKDEYYSEYRFHYFWPFRFEKLTGRGIVPTLRQNPAYYFLIPLFIIGEFFALWKLVIKLKPDIIYAHWFTPQGINAGLVSGLTKTPFAYTSHSSDVAILQRVPMFGPFLVRYFSKNAQAITVVSRRTLEKVQKFFTDQQWNKISKKVAIIPMGVILDEFVSPNAPSKSGQQNILFLGRLVEKKGVQYLLPAFAAICDNHPQVTLTVAGDGPWLERLQEQVKELGIPNEQIVFSGYVRGDMKTNLIADADVFVVPSIITSYGDAEGLPVTLMEGLAAGKICVATNESGADDIIKNKVDGFLIPEKNIAALKTALIAALKLSPNQQSKMRRKALETAKQFSWQNIAKKYYNFLFRNINKG